MLQQVCESIRNMFITAPNPGTYTISGGAITPDVGLLEGQRMWIVGSVLNDGMYTFHSSGLKDDDDSKAVTLADETFSGSVCALSVPKEVIRIAGEAAEWMAQYGDAVSSPYQSESVIGVYSYTKATGGGSGKDTSVKSWQDVFGKRLDRWRKVNFG